jgi:hypothetical protein
MSDKSFNVNNSLISTDNNITRSTGIRFKPVRGTAAKIDTIPINDGSIYYAYDTGKIFLDQGNKRVLMGGGSGSAIFYGNAGKLTPDENELYTISFNSLENKNDSPKKDDIILNDDGAFYRIVSLGIDHFVCSLLSVSGTGEITKKIRPSITINTEASVTANIINGSEAKIYFTVTSAKDENDAILDNKLTVLYSLSTDASGIEETYYTSTVTAEHNVERFIDVGPYLRDDTATTVKLIASSANHDEPSATRSHVINTTKLLLK